MAEGSEEGKLPRAIGDGSIQICVFYLEQTREHLFLNSYQFSAVYQDKKQVKVKSVEEMEGII